jgi:voltage-gated potassium channel
MTDTTKHPDLSGDSAPDVDDPSGRLAAYMARTQTTLDLLALATLWIVVVPPGDFGTKHHASTIALVVRIGVSVIYGIDMAIRSALARRHLHYLRSHPVGIAAVIFPPVRVIFSLRLVRSMFQRGNLGRFLLAASVLVLNGAIIVYLFERHAPSSNIHTLGDSVWWSFVTVTTVGYGDFYPVTTPGRVTACFIMGIGLLTLAVITAQVASSFVAQSSNTTNDEVESATSELSPTELDRRLDLIEELIRGLSSAPEAG